MTMTGQLPTISVIIPTIGRDPAVLNLCLVLLDSQTDKPDEIIVVDQTPESDQDPDARKFLKELDNAGRIKYLTIIRRGLTIARNEGIRAAVGDVFVFLDDDVFIPPNYIAAYRRLFSGIGVNAVAGQVRSGAFPLPTRDIGFSYYAPLENFELIPGGNMAIRSSVCWDVGGFDENFVGACDREDMNFAFRLRKMGFSIHYDPNPWIYHIFLQNGGGRSKSILPKENFFFNATYAAMGILTGQSLYSYLWLKVIRPGIFCREIIFRPWYFPSAFYRFIIGYQKARKKAIQPKLLTKTSVLNIFGNA